MRSSAFTWLILVPAHIAGDSPTVRMRGTSGKPLFCLADLCKVLGIGNSSQVSSRIPADEKVICLVDTPGGPQEMTFITEPGLYRVLLTTRSKSDRRPDAAVLDKRIDDFKTWVFADVLPSIRKYGVYPPPLEAGDHILSEIAQIQHALTVAAETRKAQLELEHKHAQLAREQAQLEHKQGQLEVEIAKVEKIAVAAKDRADSNYGLCSILGWLRRQGKDCTVQQAATLGKRASHLCRTRGVDIQQTKDIRFGMVNIYPENILSELFGPDTWNPVQK